MLAENGFEIINDIYSEEETGQIVTAIETSCRQSPNVRQSADVFAIRQVFREMPDLKKLVFNRPLQQVIRSKFGDDYFLVKAIYFG